MYLFYSIKNIILHIITNTSFLLISIRLEKILFRNSHFKKTGKTELLYLLHPQVWLFHPHPFPPILYPFFFAKSSDQCCTAPLKVQEPHWVFLSQRVSQHWCKNSFLILKFCLLSSFHLLLSFPAENVIFFYLVFYLLLLCFLTIPKIPKWPSMEILWKHPIFCNGTPQPPPCIYYGRFKIPFYYSRTYFQCLDL